MSDVIESCLLCNGVSGLYRITCDVTGKSYVGRSMSIGERVAGHFYILRKGTHYNRKLQIDFDLYGELHFTFEVLVEAPGEYLKQLEDEFIKKTPKGESYNKRRSGNTGAEAGFSDETRKKLSERQIGEKNHFYGKKHTAETIARMKISAAKKKLMN